MRDEEILYFYGKLSYYNTIPDDEVALSIQDVEEHFRKYSNLIRIWKTINE